MKRVCPPLESAVTICDMKTSTIDQGDTQILFNSEQLDTFDGDIFNPESNHNLVGLNQLGRGTAYIFQFGSLSLVLRRYQRGGLFRHWLKNRYFYRTLDHTRMWQEFHLLDHMKTLSLPVPTPIAARCVRHSLFTYSGDLVTQTLPDCQTLAEHLRHSPMVPEHWSLLGSVISRFHQHNVFHSDLNANNILVNKHNQFFLIDFDKSAIRPHKPAWKLANLKRLQRSLKKIQQQSPRFQFSDADWCALQRGYQGKDYNAHGGN